MERIMICFAIINTILEFFCIKLLSEKIIKEDRTVRKKLLFTIYFFVFCCGIVSNICYPLRFLFVLNYFFMVYLISKEYAINVLSSIKYVIISVTVFGLIELAVYFVLYWLFYFLGLDQDIVQLVMAITVSLCLILKKKGVLYAGKELLYRWDKTLYLIFICVALIFFYYLNLIKISDGIFLKDFIILFVLLGVLLFVVYKVYANHMEEELHHRYSEQYSEIIIEIRSRQHKFMNQLQSICTLSEIYKTYDELVMHQREEIDALEHYMFPNKLLILERPLIITHIYNKMCEAEEKHINMHLEISCSLQDIGIPDIYMIEIIGNLLDNAMEEVEIRHLNEKIYFLINYFDDEMICIECSNEHDKIPFNEYKQYFSYGFSAKNSHQGIGLAHIKKIVNKYGGYLEVGNIEKNGVNCFSVCVFIKTGT